MSWTPGAIAVVPVVVLPVRGSDQMARASSATNAMPTAPQIPYATPTGVSARNVDVSRVKAETYPITATIDHVG